MNSVHVSLTIHWPCTRLMGIEREDSFKRDYRAEWEHEADISQDLDRLDDFTDLCNVMVCVLKRRPLLFRAFPHGR
jgi:hypothetical protein